jgi:ADP-heptose:LPS heptosyltransferase
VRILVYSMGEVIGDGLIKLPFAAGLRAAFPEAHIAWAAAKGETVYAGALAKVVEGLIDEVVTTKPTGAAPLDILPWVRPFGGATFDLVIDTQENLRRSAVARRAVAKSGRFVSPAQSRGDWPEALADRLASLLETAAPDARPAAVRLADPAVTAEALRLLPQGPSYVGFAPGSGGTSKRWPIENYIALATEQADLGRTPVFFLGPQEVQEKVVIEASLPNSLFPEQQASAAFRGPPLVIALAGRLVAAVANDAGPGHMLAAGGAPLLSLQRDARKASKFKPAARRLEMLVASDYGEEMAAISVQAARQAMGRLLDRNDR